MNEARPSILAVLLFASLGLASASCVLDANDTESAYDHELAVTSPLPIPGTIQAEGYRAGGEGVGYHDSTAANLGGACTADAVDKKWGSDPAGGGCVIGWFQAGEWLAYDVTVASSGVYDLVLRVARGNSGDGSMHIEVDGQNVTGAVVIPSTGSWTTFTNVTKKGISLTAGPHTLKVFNDVDFYDLNWFSFTAETQSTATGIGPQSSIACPSGSVLVSPGQSIQSAIDGHATGTAFCLGAGTHSVSAPLVPKDNQQFIGQYGATLTGNDATENAFRGSASGVAMKNLVIEHFHPPLQHAAIDPRNYGGGVGWVVENDDVHSNSGAGIEPNSGSVVRNTLVHENGQEGIAGGGSNILVEGNEIYLNNTSCVDPGWEAGASKFWATTGLIVRNNSWHDNLGPGIWLDTNNDGFLIEGNTVRRSQNATANLKGWTWGSCSFSSSAAGIFIEVSYSGTIRNNVVEDSGKPWAAWLWGGGILVAASGGSGLEVYGNTVTNDGAGIALIQQNRGTGSLGPWLVQNVNVHDNTVTMCSGQQTGAVQDVGDNAIFTSRNNRFQANAYRIPSASASSWAWMNGSRTWSAWRGYGLDTTGSLTTIATCP